MEVVANCNNHRLYETGLQDEQDKIKPILKIGTVTIFLLKNGDDPNGSSGKLQ